MLDEPREGRLARACRWLVGGVLVATGVGKALDVPGFVDVVAAYDLLPPTGSWVVAHVLPPLELATGASLLARVMPRGFAVVAVGLHAMLVVVVITTLVRGIPVENCGCFGVFLARPLGLGTLVEDAVMLAASGVVLHSAWGGGGQ